jgi:hypothetical protein
VVIKNPPAKVASSAPVNKKLFVIFFVSSREQTARDRIDLIALALGMAGRKKG